LKQGEAVIAIGIKSARRVVGLCVIEASTAES